MPRHECEVCKDPKSGFKVERCAQCQRWVCPKCAGFLAKANGKGAEWVCTTHVVETTRSPDAT